MAVFKREKLIDISKRKDNGALVKRLESEIKELDREISVLESELSQQLRENEQLKQQLNTAGKGVETESELNDELEKNQKELERLSSLIDQYELQVQHLQAEQVSHDAISTSQPDVVLEQLREENQQLKQEIDLILTQTVDQQEKQIVTLQEALRRKSNNDSTNQEDINVLMEQIQQQELVLCQTQELLDDREVKLKDSVQNLQDLLQAKQDLEQAAKEDVTLIDRLKQELYSLQEREIELESSLSEQQAQGRNYDALQSDYESLQNQIIELKQALDSKTAALAEATATISTQDAQFTQCQEAYVQELKSIQSALDTQLNENEDIRLQYQKELGEKNHQLSEITEQHAQGVQRCDMLESRIQELEAELDSKSKIISRLTQKITQVTNIYTDENEGLKSEVVSLEKELEELTSNADIQRQEIARIEAVLIEKDAELTKAHSDILTYQETLTARISELDMIQSESSEKTTDLLLRLTTITQKLYEEQSKTIQLQADLSELRLQYQIATVEKETLLSEKEQELMAEKKEATALKQELATIRSTYQKLHETNQLTKTKIEDDKVMAGEKIIALEAELSEEKDTKHQQVALLQSIISENKALVTQLDHQVEELKVDNQRLAEEKKQSMQELQAATQDLHQKLIVANEKNQALESELLTKEECNQQELSDMMLMISRLKHDVIEEANLEIERRREAMKEEERIFKHELHKEASKLLTEVSDFKAKFIEPVED